MESESPQELGQAQAASSDCCRGEDGPTRRASQGATKVSREGAGREQGRAEAGRSGSAERLQEVGSGNLFLAPSPQGSGSRYHRQ